ncbi:hypothetical protein L1889_16440 [Paenalcaligenes niemegkensis]|nr:hypothetical protein [Paenalcaligenes niemegkensis]MCQ9618064.1 hypothetical protein [Paenalcaligenes niemegkensis]
MDHTGIAHPKIHFVSSIAASMQLIDAGICVGAVPLAAFRQGLAEGRFAPLLCPVRIPDLRLVASWRPDPVSGLGEAVVAVGMDEMRAYAQRYADATAPVDTSAFLI